MGSGAGCLGGARGKRASRGPPLCWGAAGEPGCPLGVPGAARTGGFCAARGKRWEKAGAREWRLRSCTRADWPASGSRRGAWARRALGAAPPGAPSWSLAAQGLRGRTRQRSSKCVCVCVCEFFLPFSPDALGRRTGWGQGGGPGGGSWRFLFSSFNCEESRRPPQSVWSWRSWRWGGRSLLLRLRVGAGGQKVGWKAGSRQAGRASCPSCLPPEVGALGPEAGGAAGGTRAVTWSRFSGAARARRGRGEAGDSRPGPPERSRRPPAASGRSWLTAPGRGARGGLSAGPGGPLRVQGRSQLSFRPGSSRPRWAHFALRLRDRGRLPAVGWSPRPPWRRETASLIPKTPAFFPPPLPLGWSGSWEAKERVRGRCARGERRWPAP